MVVVSSPARHRSIKLREKPWLRPQPWHTDAEKERLRDLVRRLYVNPHERRREVYEIHKPSWVE